jgi:hypothetical protein
MPPGTTNGIALPLPPRTLRAEVEELFDQAYDTGEIIDKLRRDGLKFEDRSVIVMCSMLRLCGDYKGFVPPTAEFQPMYLRMEGDRRKALDIQAQERLMKAQEVALKCIDWLIDEDLVRFCPYLPPVGGA